MIYQIAIFLCKIYADDTSKFSRVDDKDIFQINLNNDLLSIKGWPVWRKMQVNPDPSKQTNGVYFSKKANFAGYLPIKFNDSPVQLFDSQKHLGLILNKHLNFNVHIEEKMKDFNKLVGSIKFLSSLLPKKSLLKMYKSFVWPHHGCSDILHDNSENEAGLE